MFSPNAGKCGKNVDQNNCEYGLFLRSALDEPLPEKTETISPDVNSKIKMPEVKVAIEPFPISND